MFALTKSILLILVLAGWQLSADPVRVWVGIPPLAELVRSVGGDAVEVHLLAGPGQSHETFSPSARQLRSLAHADIYFSMGLPFEAVLLQRISASMPQLLTVDSVADVPELKRTDIHRCNNCHAHASDAHTHSTDPHRWLSPAILLSQVQVIEAHLAQLRPHLTKDFRSNTARIIDNLNALDQELQSTLARLRGSAFFINHPALGYFAEHCGLRQIAIETEGLQPSPARIRELSQQARESNVRWVVIQSGQPRTAAATLAQSLRLPIVEVDPFNPDALGEMRSLAKALAQAHPTRAPSNTHTR